MKSAAANDSHQAQLDAAASRKHQAKFDAFPAEWRAMIATAEAKQKALQAAYAGGKSWSDAEFIAGTPIKPSSWSLLKSGGYPLPKTPGGIASISNALRTLLQRCTEIDLMLNGLALRAAEMGDLPGFTPDINVAAMKAAIEKCNQRAAEASEERLVVLRGATGEGKSWLRRHLMREGLVHFTVNARPSWKSSYTAFLRAVACTLRVDVASIRGVAATEAEILDKAANLSGAIWFEEVQRLSNMAQEFIKTLLNETKLAVIISLTPEAYAAMQHAAGGDFAQLFRRAAGNFEMTPADDDFVKRAHPDLWQRPHDAAAPARIAAEAAAFGGKALIREVCSRLAKSAAAEITMAAVEAAIRAYRTAVPNLAHVRRTGQETRKAA